MSQEERSVITIRQEERAAIFVGGSVRGIFQAGVLKRIIEKYGDVFRFLGGNSVGSLAASFMGQYPMGELEQARQDYTNIWWGLRSADDLWKMNLFSIFKALYDNGISSPKPVQELIQGGFSPERLKSSERIVRISTVDVLKGYREYDESNITWKEIYGSTAMPFGCPAMLTDDAYLSDGGVLKSGPVSTAIKLGFKKLDIILNGPIGRIDEIPYEKWKSVKPMAKFAMRILSMILDQQFANNMKLALAYNLLAQASLTDRKQIDVNIYAPKKSLAKGLVLMELSPEKLREWYAEGLQTEPIGLEEFLESLG